MPRARLVSLATFKARVTRRIGSYGVVSHLLGLWLRTRVQKAGILIVRGGWPLPAIENRGGYIEIGNCGLFSGVRLECWRGARISIGHGTYLNRNVEVVAAGSVRIGRDCKIARDVIIMDTDQHAIADQELIVRPVVIGDRVWIGSRAMILKGVTLGHDSVVGAGAIVTRSVPPFSVVVGPAARVLKTLEAPISPPATADGFGPDDAVLAALANDPT